MAKDSLRYNLREVITPFFGVGNYLDRAVDVLIERKINGDLSNLDFYLFYGYAQSLIIVQILEMVALKKGLESLF